MTQQEYQTIESYMLACMQGSAHDRAHVYRVLYTAMDIAATLDRVDTDVLIAACLLHDIGRKEQLDNPALCHAQVGGEKAYRWLLAQGYDAAFADHVRRCIVTHRFRANNPPQSTEAKILFDADKLDAAGAIGCARTLLYQGEIGEPLYTLRPDGTVSDGSDTAEPSFFHEYRYKLDKLYAKFFTPRAQQLAAERQAAARAFYEQMRKEAAFAYQAGQSRLRDLLAEG